ncbi:hypothetical protein RUM43_013938 [Polyplax serrata]|uniref:TIR domain-containing protein n=1 Tax=Polyplax serrata TaxID=468196 RepID=A0AAN8S692_POLSC
MLPRRGHSVENGGHVLHLFGFVLVAILHSSPASARHDIPNDCLWSSGNETAVSKTSVSCSFGNLDVNGLTSLQADGTLRLSVTCWEKFNRESFVPPAVNRLLHLEELSLEGCKILKLLPLGFDGLRELRKLSIHTRNHEWEAGRHLEVSEGSMSGLKELQVLDLGRSNVKAVPDEIYCPLVNLQTLNLTRNRIRDVNKIGFGSRSRPSGECSGGFDIRHLDLSHNEVKSLKNDSDLTKLKRLQSLYLQHNDMTDITSGALAGLVSLRVLNVSNNNLESLPEGLFVSCRELREVYLQNNKLTELSSGIFHRLEQLLVLDLSGNKLTSNHIDDGTFLGLIRLIVLNLSHNSLSRIGAKTFKDLFFLQILDLRNNSLQHVEENAFLPLYNLHTLNLAENRLHNIDSHLFNGLYVLSKLTLSRNKIVSIDQQAFRNCSDLKELDLSSNSLAEVPEALRELSFLKTLDLGENKISGFRNGSFKGLSQLTGLRLVDNDIGNLTKGMFWDLPSLEVLNLAKNKVQQIERGTFDFNNQLQAIRLDANFLVDINGVFASLQSLLWLNLSENHLVWFDYAFIPLNVKWLDVHGNFIESLGNYYKIQDELNIRTLDASHNRISTLTPLSIPNSVELVFINNNFITNVHPNTFYDKTNLARVDMYANQIEKLDINALRLKEVQENKTLPEFYIGGNPFHCDCSMDWLPMINNMSQRQYPKVMDLDNVMCRLTFSRGSTLAPTTETKSSDYLCKYETHCFTLCHCCDYDACDCEMTCPQNCSCYHDEAWTTNIVECSNRKLNEIPLRIPMDANEVYLDGNYLKELQNHVFIGRKNMRVLYVNNSHVESIQNRTFNGLNSLQILHLEDNDLHALKGFEFEHLSHLRELYLQNNKISYIGNMTLLPLRSLEILRLDNNRLVKFPVWQLTLNTYLVEVTLSNNQWSCRCKFLLELQTWISDNEAKVTDSSEIMCVDNNSRPPYRRSIEINNTACSDYYSGSSVIQSLMVSHYWPMVVVTLSAFVFILFPLLLIFIFRDSLKVWIYTKYGVRIWNFKGAVGKSYEDREKLYDGYVCYSPKDEEFVLQSIVAELEHGSPSFQLCLHYRDLPQPSPYMQNSSPVVVEAAEASKRVILVLSRNFLQTEWSRFEFRQALHEALKGRIFKLVLVEEGSSLPEAELDPDLRPYLKTGARVRWGEKRFWERLRYAMPSEDKHHTKSTNYRRNINNYTLDSSVGNGGHHSYPEKSKRLHPSSPSALQHNVNSHPLFKAAMAAAMNDMAPPAYSANVPPSHDVDEANYSSAATATPSPKLSHRHHQSSPNEMNSRPNSEHIYSSIDSDYSTLERNSSRRQNGVLPRPGAPWRPSDSIISDSAGVQAYLV